MTTALITGPTAGIGAAFAGQLAAKGFDLVLVARSEGRLQEQAQKLRAAHHVDVEVIVADLSRSDGCLLVTQRLGQGDRPVDILINNAGFGLKQNFIGGDLSAEEDMLNVLVVAVLRLTHAALPGMIGRGHGQIINVSSVAGWIPGGTYSAAKSWVTVFTESLQPSLGGTGVSVTAVCPGYTHTEFHERAAMTVSMLPEWMWLDADDVAAKALMDSSAGIVISVPSRRYQALSLASRYAPRPLVRHLMGRAPRPQKAR